jgi:hypothetical protein
MAARTAVVAGTATAVSGGVRQRQTEKAQEAQEMQQTQASYEQQAQAQQVAAPTGGITDEGLAKLTQLAQLKEQGVLTEEEFAAQKAKILGT